MIRQMRKEWAQRQTEEYRNTKQKILGAVFLGVSAIGATMYFMSQSQSSSGDKLSEMMGFEQQSNEEEESLSRRLLGFPAADGESTFSKSELRSGAVILHLMGMCYMFLAIAIICDEFFVPAIDVIVEKLKLSPDAAGATFMAAGGSAPELFTSFIGVWITKDDVGIGTIVGSAVFNVLFVIGCCAIFSLAPLKLTWWPFFRDCSYYCMSLLVLAAFFNLSSEGQIQWWEALFLFFLYFGYVALMFNNEAVFTFVNSKLLKKNSKKIVDGQEVEDVSQMQVARPLQFTVSVFNLMTADADISELAGIHIVARMKGDAKTTFNSLDTDSNGFIDRNEFAQCLKRLGNHVTQAEVDQCFDQIDENKSNTIDFDEFSKWYVTSQWKIKQDVEHIFKKFDHNNDGTIDTGEIFDLLKAVNPDDEITDAAVEEARKVLDTNNDGHVSLQEFLKWWDTSLFFQNERKRRATIADAEEKQHEEGDGLKLDFPENTPGRIMYLISVPIIFPLYYTVPDVRRSEWWAQWYPVTLLMSMIWLAIYSTLMVFFANVFGDVCGIPPQVMGLTLLAAGTSVPDLLTSVIVARAGHGDMAVSSSIGSNIFDILVGLPVPWLTFCCTGKSVKVSSDGIALSILILFGMIFSVLLIIIWQNWIMTNFLGYAMFALYVVFVIQDLMRVKSSLHGSAFFFFGN